MSQRPWPPSRRQERAISTRPLRWVPVALWAGFLFLLSAQQGADLPATPAIFLDKILAPDTIAHLGLYGILGFFVGLAGMPHGRMAWLALLCGCVIYGLSDEVHQLFVVGRYFEVSDLIADAVGSLAGLLAAKWGLRLIHSFL